MNEIKPGDIVQIKGQEWQRFVVESITDGVATLVYTFLSCGSSYEVRHTTVNIAALEVSVDEKLAEFKAGV